MTKREMAEIKKISEFSKEQLLRSQRYAGDRDLIRAFLEDGGSYTLAEVDEVIKKYKEEVR